MALSTDLKLFYEFPASGPLVPTASLGPTLTFTNASADRSYYTSSGTLAYAAANEPRPDHDPAARKRIRNRVSHPFTVARRGVSGNPAAVGGA